MFTRVAVAVGDGQMLIIFFKKKPVRCAAGTYFNEHLMHSKISQLLTADWIEIKDECSLSLEDKPIPTSPDKPIPNRFVSAFQKK